MLGSELNLLENTKPIKYTLLQMEFALDTYELEKQLQDLRNSADPNQYFFGVSSGGK